MRDIFFVIILLIVATLIMPLLITTSCDMQISLREDMAGDGILESSPMVSVYNHRTKGIMSLDLEEYVANVVAAEMPAAFEFEALKAQAVAARTFAIWRQLTLGENGDDNHPGASICTSHTHCQEWLSTRDLEKLHGGHWMENYWPKIQRAVEDTRGIVMTYDNEPIEPLYHSTSGGKTENSEDVFASAIPYLRGVASPYEEESPVFTDEKELSTREFIRGLKALRGGLKVKEADLASEIRIVERSPGGIIKRIEIANESFTGSDIRRLFDLRSSDFTLEIGKGRVVFTTRGYGHGVGMSQWGANGMASRGNTYKEILEHYYRGVVLNRLVSHRK